MRYLYIYFAVYLFGSCNAQTQEDTGINQPVKKQIVWNDSNTKFIHVFVALCDNKYQGIVKVPAGIGNGQDPPNNLYWGCGYGMKGMFAKSTEWRLVKSMRNPDSLILERLVYKHKSKNIYLVADGYNGKFIGECTQNYVYGLAGAIKDTVQVGKQVIGLYGNAALLAYCGHNVLMDDVQICPDLAQFKDSISRNAITICCFGKPYFRKMFHEIGAKPLVWSTNLMSAEAYTLHDALSGYVLNESAEEIRLRAAASYAKYQKCGIGPAKGLLVTGF